MSELTNLMNALFRGDVDAVMATWGETPRIHDQRLGELRGEEEARRWVTQTHAWLRDLQATRSVIADLRTDNRLIQEVSLDITVEGQRVDLPFVLVADRGSDGLEELRTYHSTWPYTGEHVFRAPPLEGRPQEPPPEIFGWYIDRVREADVDPILARFSQDGYVREPSGARWRHQGAQARADFYGHLRHAPRATFDLMTSTVDGDLIAVEYGFSYGDVDKVGGICVMETRDDEIVAIRITDDVGV